MLVVDNDGLDAFQRHDDEVVDLLKAALGLLFPVYGLEVKFQVFGGPLSSMIPRILLAILLDRHIRQMHEHIIDLSYVRRIQLIAKPPKSLVKHPRLQRAIRRHQTVHSQVKLLPTDKHWIVNVARDHPHIVRLEVLKRRVEVGPRDNFFQLVDLLQQKYPLSL